MEKPVKRVFTMENFLRKLNNKEIRKDQRVQRLSGAWDNNMFNEIIFTVLTEDHVAEVVLGENLNNEFYLIDGLQRATSFNSFRHQNKKITSLINDSMVEYYRNVKDENGNVVREKAVFDIKGATYDKLPQELKDIFNEFQIDTVIHKNCSDDRLSMLVKRYNNHKAMNCSQQAFTNVSKFAEQIREITNGDFFKEGMFKQSEKIKGTFEKIVMETDMATFHLDKWKKASKKMGEFINDGASHVEFNKLAVNFERLAKVVTDDTKEFFKAKNTFVFVALFDKFTDYSNDDKRFNDFLIALKEELHSKEVDGTTFDEINANRATKDKYVVETKLRVLESLLYDFMKIGEEKENYLSDGIDDMELCNDILTDLVEKSDIDADFVEKNHLAFARLVQYSLTNEIDLDNWLKDKHEEIAQDTLWNMYIAMRNSVCEYVSCLEKVA